MSAGLADVGLCRQRSAIAAAITVFRPEAALLAALVQTLHADGLPILVHIDGPTGDAVDAPTRAALEAVPGLTILQAQENEGLGAGLNRLAEAAEAAGFRRIALFDQDSGPAVGSVEALSLRLDRLIAEGERAAAVGPCPVPPAGLRTKPPHYRRGRRIEGMANTVSADFVITSGSVLDLAAYAEVGPFREDYVIDAIDTEWCFRAAAKGWEVFLAEDIEMPHRVGAGTIRVGPLAFPRQSPARMRTYVRNQAHGLRLPHVPLRWKLRVLAYLPLQALTYSCVSTKRLATACLLLRAARDGLAGRLGRLP